MKVFITGASSYVGAKIYFDLKNKYELTGSFFKNSLSKDFVKLDVTDEKQTVSVISKYSPEAIIHAAANASGSWCEEHPKEAIAINEGGTKNVIAAARRSNSLIIFVSSYAVHETSLLYGRTKVNSERFIKESGLDYLILRPSLIVGYSPNTTNDRPMNRLLKNLDEGTPATYDTSWKFYPTYLRHISEVIDTCIKKSLINEVIPIASDKVVSRYDLAKDILSPFGVDVQPEDKKSKALLTKEDLSILRELGLPTYSYLDMVVEIIKEIKNRERFVLE